jgi:transposase
MTDKEQIADLKGQLSHALTRIAELEAWVVKLATVKISKNSHNPPSSDKARKNQSLREKSGKPVGGQKGCQVLDIPPIVPVMTEYQSFGTRCTCGYYQCGHFPPGVTNHVQYGKNIPSLVIYQSYYQFLPAFRIFSKKYATFR